MSIAEVRYGLFITTFLVISLPVSYLKCISCRCGSSNTNYTHCIENEHKEDIKCDAWAKCQTCKNNTTYCITCPQNRFGPLCTEGVHAQFRKKRQTSSKYRSSHCVNAGHITNGRVTVRRSLIQPLVFEEDEYELPVGTRLHYSCNEGYDLRGMADLICEDNGFWSEEKPSCVEVTCDKLYIIPNGRVVVNYLKRQPNFNEERDLSYPMGTILLYSCGDGYMLIGNKTLQCESSGQWSADKPTCIPDCGHSEQRREISVPEGRLADTGEFPWTVFLYFNQTENPCAGVLINNRTVLTAAHCAENSEHCTLYFGKYNRSTMLDDRFVETRTSSQIIIHPELNRKTFENNIAIVKFDPDVLFSARVQPICMPSTESTAKNIVPGKIAYVMGWWLNRDKIFSPKMMVVPIPIQEPEICELAYLSRNVSLKITNGIFCAGFTNETNSVCIGGSGSPLVFYDGATNRFNLEGLVSMGMSGLCYFSKKYTLYTKVSHYLQWIQQHLY